MNKRIVRRVASVAVAAAVATGAPVAAGPAATGWASRIASSSRWRITQKADLTVGGLWAGGARDAWLAGGVCNTGCGGDTGKGTVIIWHWDGRAWRAVRAPRAYIKSPIDQGAGPVAATSASDAWIFADRGRESVDYTDVLHWTGRTWAKPVRLNTAIEAAVAPSPTAVWAFGPPMSQQRDGYVAHYNGRTWTHHAFPIDASAAGSHSATDIWVGSQTGTGRLVMEHWNGHSWHAIRLPALSAGRQEFAYIVGISVTGPRDAWAAATADSGSAIVSYLLHWNGRAWTRARFPHGVSADSTVVPDGHGGLWLAATTGSGRTLTFWFLHYRSGRWTKTPVPTVGTGPFGQINVDQIAWIPRTHSLWATGDLLTGTAILKYGP